MRMKNWIEWINKISKIWEKIRTRTYFKFLHIVSRLWADCERQSRGKSKWSRKTSHNVSGIPLTMWGTNLNEDAYCFTESKEHALTNFKFSLIISDQIGVWSKKATFPTRTWCPCWNGRTLNPISKTTSNLCDTLFYWDQRTCLNLPQTWLLYWINWLSLERQIRGWGQENFTR